MESKKSFVSIGLPVFNGEPYLKATLESILSQSYTNFELIISDNASTDGTEKICLDYSVKDSRVRYIRQQGNIGGTANYQFVLDEAVGDYFIWMAADDLQEGKFVEVLVRALDKDSKTVLAMTDVKNIDDRGQALGADVLELASAYGDESLSWPQYNFFRNPISNIYFAFYGLYRRKVLTRIELNYENLLLYATGWEIPLLAQVALLGSIVRVQGPFKIYRRHDKSMYHSEIKGFGLLEFFKNDVNISHVLLRIIVGAKISLRVKISLFWLWFCDLSKIIVKFVIKFVFRIGRSA